MPTYRSINIALHSQFDIETLPEYYPAALPLSPSLSTPPKQIMASPPTPTPTALPTPIIPPLTDDATSTTSVHVPILPGSQFWLAYSVFPPVPEGHHFLFKLYVDGARVMSWATGKEQGWRGKMVFGLFEGEGGRGVQRRVLCFGSDAGEGLLEVRVHRASGRRRVEREMQRVEELGLETGNDGLRLVNAGRAGPEQPKRFYRFKLIDPVDQPFATFRYYCHSWEQLRNMGLLNSEYYAESEGEELSIIEPGEEGVQHDTEKESTGSGKGVQENLEGALPTDGDGISVHDWFETKQQTDNVYVQASATTINPISLGRSASHRDSIASGSYIPRGAAASEISTGSPPSLRRRSRKDMYRLSVPPSIKLVAPDSTSQPLPVPLKNDTSSTAYRPHPAYPIEEWTVRTPSPVGPVRDAIATPPQGKRGVIGVGAGLMGVVQWTWRSISAAQATRKGGVGAEKRSVSY
ncbi:hypothetical protein SVAN01_08354 [Stagonosporopsis vannaccii]|nr:hypothetical protein SVAN01_08354 [Stagonosporopsis vannaccii]